MALAPSSLIFWIRRSRCDRGLHVDAQPIRPRVHEILDVALRVVDHQVDVQGQGGGLTDGPDHCGADGDVGDEVAVHDVHVDPVHPGGLRQMHLFRQAAEIRG